MDISCTTGFSGGLIKLSGELDHHAAAGAIKAAAEFIEEFKPGEVRADMSRVNFMDSSGIAFLLSALRRVRMYGGKLTVTGLNSQCRRVLESAGVARLLCAGEEKYI